MSPASTTPFPSATTTKQIVISLAGFTFQQEEDLRNGLEQLVTRVLTPEGEDQVAGWTANTLNEALDRLRRTDAGVQADTIEEALAQGGYVTRERVFKIGRYPKSRSLRGFTRPVNRVTSDMKSEGLIPDDAAELLLSSYQDGVKADGFKTESRLRDLFDWEE